jgi:Cu(I)/Ag(I) efflux system membrane fusion protein
LQLQAIQASLQKKFRESVLANIRQAGTSIPQRQRLESETQLVSAKIQYEAIHEQLRLLGLTADQIDSIVESGELMPYYPVLAPIDGVVVGFSKAVGHVVSADEELFELHDTSQRLIEAFVSEKDAGAIRPGQRLRCKPVAQDHSTYPGVVISSGQSLSNKGQTLSVWAKVDFDQDSLVFHNMLCSLSIDLLDDDGLDAITQMMPVVPVSSVLQEGTQSYIFVALTDGTFERRCVSLGRSDDSYVIVLSGLSDQETVVTQGVSALQTGYAAVQ